MKLSNTARSPALEGKTFLLLLVVVSLGFAWVLWPYYGAVFWAAVFAIMFTPIYNRLLRKMPSRPTGAALITLAIILLLVILPVALITASLVQEAASVYQRMQSGDFSINRYFQQVFSVLPTWVTNLLDRFGLNNFGIIQQRLTESMTKGSQFLATQALSIGQNTFDFVVSFFVMLYVQFFLLRDGAKLSRRIEHSVPLDSDIKRELLEKFITVTRATVKGNVVVALVQGALGGLTFWALGVHAPVLWGTLMAFLSLLPAVGAALVWGPVAIYFFATGALWPAFILVFVGVGVIGLVDNILRPLLVGKDTKMPDYVVLVSTIGGMAIFGLNGFVIGPVVAAMFMATWDLFGRARETPDAPLVLATPDAPVTPPAVVAVPAEPAVVVTPPVTR